MLEVLGLLLAGGAIFATYHVYLKGNKEKSREAVNEALKDRELADAARDAARNMIGIYNKKMRDSNEHLSLPDIAERMKKHVLEKTPDDATSYVWKNIHLSFSSGEKVRPFHKYMRIFDHTIIRRYGIGSLADLKRHGIENHALVTVYQSTFSILVHGPDGARNNENRKEYRDLGGRSYDP